MPARVLPLHSEPANQLLPPPAAEPGRVLLVCPPFQIMTIASLSVVLLSTLLRENGIECEEAHLQFDLIRALGTERYVAITSGDDGLLAEMLFGEGLHGQLSEPEIEARLSALVGPAAERARLRARLAQQCVARIDAFKPDLIGFTTSLNQLLASLFLARVVKQHAPGIKVVLGGSSCSEPMGRPLLRAYPDVDWAVSGWGEPVLLALARGARPPRGLIESHSAMNLDSAPIPDYGAFLRDAGEFALERDVRLTYESSRGCWWGVKHHCKFCGLNGVEMAFTSKSSERVVREVRQLWTKYHKHLYSTDTILSMDHLRHAMPALGAFEDGPDIFYEVKANLSEADVIALRRARVCAIQPGIESLSTALLGQIDKGIDAIRNVALLKWCREQGINVAWHQLYGIPGEKLEDYSTQLGLMKKIPHLQPPHGLNPIRIDRFSPYFDRHREFGWERIEPFEEYGKLHPTMSPEELRDVAYHFKGFGRPEQDDWLRESFQFAIADWKKRHDRGDGLFLHPEHGLVRVEDGKAHSPNPNAGVDKLVSLTHTVTTRERVIRESGCAPKLIDQLAAHGILHTEGNKVINLVVRLQQQPIAPVV